MSSTAHQTDTIESGRHATSMETTVHAADGMIHGRTRIWTDRVASWVVGAVRVIAVDADGDVLGFTGERRLRVGGRPLRTASRTVEWSMAVFADSPVAFARLEIVHFRPPHRGVVDRFVERL
jgi:hypothetical protein